MRRLFVSWAAFSMVAVPASAQPDSPGRVIAAKICSECHLVGRSDTTPKDFAAPSFADIANMPSATLLSIKVFMRTPHTKTMPNIMLTDSEMDAVADYIMSLKRN